MTNNENEINPEALKQWFSEIKDPKQQAIVTNIEILKLETYVKDRNFVKQDYEEEQEMIKDTTLQDVLKDETLTNETKRKSALLKRLADNQDYMANEVMLQDIKKDIINTEINISFYKRTFQILITFGNEWVK